MAVKLVAVATYHGPDDFTSGRVAYSDVVIDEQTDRVWHDIQTGIRAGTRFTIEYPIRAASGSFSRVLREKRSVWTDDLVQAGGGRDVEFAVREDISRVSRITGMATDITERK